LSASTCAAGFVAAGGLVAAGLRNAKNADVARGGLLTAAFFLAGLIRVPLPGTSVHLLLGSLNGIALGSLCFPSIFLALLLQAVLLGHGGVSTLGVNTVMMSVPAYFTGVMFHRGVRRGVSGWPLFFLALSAVCVLGPKLLFDALLAAGFISFTLSWLLSTITGMSGAIVLFAIFRWAVRLSPVYCWGFAAGALAVLGSSLLFLLVLSYAPLAGHTTREGFVELARFAFLSHIPVVLAEGLIVALLIKYLDTVSPELLRLEQHVEGDVNTAADITQKPKLFIYEAWARHSCRARGDRSVSPTILKRAFLIRAVIIFTAIILPSTAFAHSASADAYVTDDGRTIVVEAWMDGGKVPSGGKVTVLSPDGSVRKTGELVKGQWSFVPDILAQFTFVVELGHGHGKTFGLHPDEMKKLEAGLESAGGQITDAPETAGTRHVAPRKPRQGKSDQWLKIIVGFLVIGELVLLGWVWRLRRELAAMKKDSDIKNG